MFPLTLSLPEKNAKIILHGVTLVKRLEPLEGALLTFLGIQFTSGQLNEISVSDNNSDIRFCSFTFDKRTISVFQISSPGLDNFFVFGDVKSEDTLNRS